MFGINPQVAPSRVAVSAKRANASGGQRFSLSDNAASPARLSGVAQAMPPDALFALQAEGDATERRRRQVKRGHGLLDALDRLKAALLAGSVPGAQLSQLKMMLQSQGEAVDDPQLADLLAHIELRVAVELAKLEMRG